MNSLYFIRLHVLASSVSVVLYFVKLALNYPPYTWTQYPLHRAFLGLFTDACKPRHIYLYGHLCICRGLYHDLLTRHNLTLDLSTWHKHRGRHVWQDLLAIHLIGIGWVHVHCARRALVNISCHWLPMSQHLGEHRYANRCYVYKWSFTNS